MWKIEDFKNNRYILIPENSLINMGNIPECDVQISIPGNNPYFVQIFLESNFIYFFHENNCTTYLNSHEFQIHRSLYKINHDIQETELNLNQVRPNYKEINEIYSSTEFQDSLLLIQQILSENNHFENNHFKFSQIDVFIQSCKICDEFFWKKYNIFDKIHRETHKKFIWLLWAQICEFGILTLPMQDNDVSEIMVNESHKIYLEKNGVLFLSPLQFYRESDLYSIIERICSSMGRRIDESMPYCDTRLKDGSRVHAIIPPLALNGPCLTIRKFPKTRITPLKLIEMNSISHEVYLFLKNIVENKKNILISGGTGSGKTTLLNCLSFFIPENERIITIEDSAELNLLQEHVIRLESRNEN